MPIYDIGRQAGHHYFSMKLVEGKSLSQAAAEFAGDKRATADLLAKIAAAIHHAHQRGVLHRDLKPGNILIDAEGEPHVTDFGLARQVESENDLTRTGAILGTPAYMPPEQAQGDRQITTAADVYSLGAILYELLTGRPPFRSDNPIQTVMQVINEAPQPPREIDPKIDRGLELICLKCLSKDPGDRYGSAEALGRDLTSWLADEPLSVRPPSAAALARMWMRQNFGGGVWMLILGVTFGVAFGFILWHATIQANTSSVDWVYERIPTFDKPWLLDYTWQIPDWLRDGSLGFGLFLLTFLGFLTAFLVRPKSRSADVMAGLVTSLIAGFSLFSSALGIMSVLSSMPNQDVQLLHHLAIDGNWGREQVHKAYPALAEVPDRQIADLLITKHQGELAGVLPLALWGGMVMSFAMSVAIGLPETVIAGPLLRREDGFLRALIPYLEQALPITALGFLAAAYVIGPLTVGNPAAVANAPRMALLLLLLAAAIAAGSLQLPVLGRLGLAAAWLWLFASFMTHDMKYMDAGVYQQRIAAAERLVEQHPENPQHVLDLSWHQSDLGYYWMNNGYYRKGAKWYRRAIDTRMPVMDRIEDASTRSEAWLNIETWHWRLAKCYDGQGQHERALETMKWFKPVSASNWRAHSVVPRDHIESLLSDNSLSPAESTDYLRDYVAFQVTRQNGEELSTSQLTTRIDRMTNWLANKQSWQVLGPFPVQETESALDADYPPDADLGAGEGYPVGDTVLKWKPVKVRSAWYVNLISEIANVGNVVGYAKTTFHCPEARLVQLGAGSDDNCKIWLNDELVMTRTTPATNGILDYEPVELLQGENTLLIKVANKSGGWGFALDFFDKDGWPAPVEWESTPVNE